MSLTPQDIQLLEQPLPVGDHEFREAGKNRDKTKVQWLVYVNLEGVIPLLNRIDPDWSWEIRETRIEASYVYVSGRLTIKGVSRDGIGGRSPNGKDAPVDEDVVKGAETDALKRAAVRFGVGLYLRSVPMCWVDCGDNYKSWEAEKEVEKRFDTWYKRTFRPVDTTTGEIIPPVNEKAKVDLIVTTNSQGENPLESYGTEGESRIERASDSDAAFDDVALATRNIDQPLALVDHPKNTRTWDIGKVANYVKFKAKHIDVEKEGAAGADKHFVNLITRLESSIQITDTSTTDEVIKVVDAHYAAKTESQTKKRKLA